MKTFARITAFALAAAIAAPAFANDQLARSLGLEPGVFTAAELAAIKGVMEDRNTSDVDHIASLIVRETGGVVSTQSVGGSSQLARSLGLDGSFTTAELAAIKGVSENRETSDADRIATLVNRETGGVVSTQSVGGTSQLARSLGLDGSFTTAELAAIKGVSENRNTSDVDHIATLRQR